MEIIKQLNGYVRPTDVPRKIICTKYILTAKDLFLYKTITYKHYTSDVKFTCNDTSLSYTKLKFDKKSKLCYPSNIYVVRPIENIIIDQGFFEIHCYKKSITISWYYYPTFKSREWHISIESSLDIESSIKKINYFLSNNFVNYEWAMQYIIDTYFYNFLLAQDYFG